MKKFTFLLLTLLFSVIGYSQFPSAGTEGFETTAGPDLAIPVAVSPWTLSTGVTGNQWAVFDNGVPAPSATQKRWTSTNLFFKSGTQSAWIDRKQNGAAGNISEDYLATPKVTVPANGQLTFWTRVGLNSADAIKYHIKVNTDVTTAGSQTTLANYNIHVPIQTWDETTIPYNADNTVWILETVDLSAYAGQQVYLAFVREFNQPTSQKGGNTWYIDDVKLVQQCVGVTLQGPVTASTTTASIAWTPAGLSATWEIEIVPVTSTPTGTGIIYNGASPYTAQNLIPGTLYVFYIRKKCTDSDSTWLGPYNFSTVQAGLTCAGPITINSLPYSVSDNTTNYGDTYDVTQPSACAGGATNYMQGNDVFYSYTAATTGAISIAMTPTGTNSSIFVYQGCSNVGVSCLAGVANTTGAVRNIASLNVTAGQTYTIVLSSSATTQTYPYSLLIQQLNCPPPTGLGATTTATTATLNWTTPATTSWQYFVQNLNDAIPTTNGTTSASNTVTTSTLNSGTPLVPGTDYQYWVRADCGNGTFSPWTGPYPFRMAPGCGGLFVDSGGQSGNYANSITAATGTTTICPTNTGDQVTVTFTSLSTQLNNDVLKVYNGSGTSGLLLGSYSGTYTAATLPHITSSAADGCLTFVFTSDAATNLPGWVANVTCAPAPACQQPILLTTGAVTYNSVPVGWTQTNNSDGSQASTWDVIAVPCGGPAPTATTTGYSSTSITTLPLSYTYNSGLLPLTCYDFYVRASCSATSQSAWSGPVSATTTVAPPICGGNFVDPGGIAGNYPNNSNVSTTIPPVNAGDQVTVTFTSFNTQAGVDLLKVYDGTDTSATGTLLATYSGVYTGAALPSITSSAPGGELTFVFTSSATVNAAGWIANVSCAVAPDCQKPILLVEDTAGTAYNHAGLSWSQTQNPDFTFPVMWQVIALPTGSAAPTDLTPLTDGYQTDNNVNYIYPGLNPLTCYDFYVRSLCTGTSLWCGPTKICTPIAPAICGGNFVDSGGIAGNYSNSETITTPITTTPGNQVTVNFTSFSTQAGSDLLKVYDGLDTSATGTLLATYSGVYTGAALPSITSSSPNGALTFVFTSNGTVTSTGWLANVICNPAPACQKPILLNAPAATIAYNQVGLKWTQTQNPDGSTPTQWQVIAVPCGGTAPTAATPLTDGQTTNPLVSTLPEITYTGLNSTVCYDFYVRSICSSSSLSAWTGPASVTTALGCGGIFTDAGGAGNYPNNVTPATGTTIITTTPGTQVTVTFTSFNTEAGIDLLKVYDGSNPATGTLLATYSGTTVPAPITSSAPNGALSFVFTSNASTNAAGWTANVTCNPSPPCQKPILITTPTIQPHSVTVAWTQTQNPDGSTPNQWEVYAVPCNSAAPANTIPVGIGQLTPVATSPQTQVSYTYTGISAETCYDFYVRAICSSTSSSAWTGVASATTTIACFKPTGVTAVSTSISTATISWAASSATQWQMLCLPAGSAPPTASSTGWQNATTYAGTTYTGLSVGQFYDVYVRAICSSIDTSTPSVPISLYIYPPLPSCAGVDLNLTTNTPGVYNLCPGSCLNLAATYEKTYTTSTYTVSSTPFAPLFPFTGGTQVSVNTDDVWSGDIALPFKFCFYGNTYNSINIGSNGAVTFNTHAANSSCPWSFTASIPSPTFPILNAIYAPFQDINPNTDPNNGSIGYATPAPQPNINYQVLGTAPCRAMVISFSQVGLYSSSCTPFPAQTSQVVLYETSNVVDVNVGNRNGCTAWNSGSGVIGLQNAAGSAAIVPPGRNTGSWSATNEAWRFLPAGPSNVTFSWLQDGTTLTTNTNTTICPTANTTLTAQAKYTACDGTVVTKSESILLNLIGQVTPTFTQIGPLCQGSTAPTLPLSSNDTPAITGTWSPATINTATPGTTTYTFTPDSGQCANTVHMDITILPIVTPTFTAIGPLCQGATAPTLPLSSADTPSITGTWLPASISTATSGTTTYNFTPNSGQCANTASLDVTVNVCTFGSYASAVWLTNCTTSNFFNTVGSGANIIGPVANVFPSSNLGTYVINSNALQLNGGEVKTYKNAISNVCSAHLYYRIYPQGPATGTFQSINLPFFSNCGAGSFITGGGPCNAGDQKWQKVLPNALYPTESPVDLTANAPGNYAIQVYYEITGSSSSTSACNETILIDNGGAFYTATFTIQEQPSYSSSNPTTCSGADGKITISGLAPNTTYGVSYNNGTITIPGTFTSNSTGQIIITGLTAGTYSQFVVTINGCSYPNSTSIVLVDPALPTVTVNNPVACTGQSATIAATPGSPGIYSYVWSVPSPQGNPGNTDSFVASVAGNYSVIITNQVTGCSSASSSGTLSFSSLIVPTFSAIAPICKGTTPIPTLPISSSNTPAITGSWSPAGIDNMASGNYVFTPSAGFCSSPITINVTVNSVPTPTATVTTQPTCSSPIGTVQVTSPLSAVGTPPPTDLIMSEVTDSNTGSLSYIEIFNGTGVTKNLSNYSIKTANNGNPYSSTLVLNNVNLASGSNYVVAIGTGGTSCSTPGGDGSLAAQTSGSGSVNFTAGGNDHFGLFNGTNQIDSWGTYGNADWAPAFIGISGADFRRKNTISPLPNTTYNDNDWNILDYAGISGDCANNDYSDVGIYSISSTSVTYQYSSDGGTTYQTSPILTGLTPGSHIITVQDTATGCTSSITVTVDPLSGSPIISGTLSACIGNTTSLSGTGTAAATNAWTSSNTSVATISTTGIVTGVSAGTSIITYTNSDGCQITATVTINALPIISGTLSACIGNTTLLSGTGTAATTNAWTSSNVSVATIDSTTGIVTGVSAGTSIITYTNSDGCQITATVTINALPSVAVSGDTVCNGAQATIATIANPAGIYTYVWTVPNGATNPNNVSTFTTTTSGTYSVVITDTTTGCKSISQSALATIAPAFDFTLTDGCLDNVFNVNVVPSNNTFDPNNAVYIWQVGGVTVAGEVNETFNVSHYMSSTTPTPTLPLIVTSIVKFNSSSSCTETHSITLNRIYCEIQNGISPNNDGKNDYFDLRLLGVQQLSIFNRYGTKVYAKTDYADEWVGQSDAGNELPDGTYYYVIEFKNNQPTKTGWIYINRETK